MSDFCFLKERKIGRALRGEIPAEEWMVECRIGAARDAEAYGNAVGCDFHVALASESYSEAQRLKSLITPNQGGR